MKIKLKRIRQHIIVCALLCPGTSMSGSLSDSIYAWPFPERTVVDVTHYQLKIEPDGVSGWLKGSNVISMERLHDGSELWLDLGRELEINSIEWAQGTPIDHYRQDELIRISLPDDWDIGAVRQVRIQFSGKPRVARRAPWDGGVVWSRDKNGRPFWGVACQGDGARIWYPCKDMIQDPPGSVELSITVPDTLKAVANGRLVGVSVPAPGQVTYTWSTSQTIHNYNLSWYVGDYVHFSDLAVRSHNKLMNLHWQPKPPPWRPVVNYEWITTQRNGFLPEREKYYNDSDTLTLDYYVLRPHISKAQAHFKQVRSMMEIMEHQFGPYPFTSDGYKLVEAPYLGMEHQSAIAYGNYYLKGYMGMDHGGQKLDYDYILIHESGHEWWGNHVAMETRADMWINEGFCTYSDALYVENAYGYPTASRFLNHRADKIKNVQPVLGQPHLDLEGSADMYDKGAAFLHTLRFTVNNDSLYFAWFRAMQRDLGGQRTSTDALLHYCNKFLGMDLTPYFVHYLGGTQPPVLYYHVQKTRSGLRVTARWDSPVPAFALPVGFSNGQTENVSLPEGPNYIRITPGRESRTWTLPKDWTQAIPDTERAYFIPVKKRKKLKGSR